MFAGVSGRDVSTVCSQWSPAAGGGLYTLPVACQDRPQNNRPKNTTKQLRPANRVSPNSGVWRLCVCICKCVCGLQMHVLMCFCVLCTCIWLISARTVQHIWAHEWVRMCVCVCVSMRAYGSWMRAQRWWAGGKVGVSTCWWRRRGQIQQRAGRSKKGTEGFMEGLSYDNDHRNIKHTLSHPVSVTHTRRRTQFNPSRLHFGRHLSEFERFVKVAAAHWNRKSNLCRLKKDKQKKQQLWKQAGNTTLTYYYIIKLMCWT